MKDLRTEAIKEIKKLRAAVKDGVFTPDGVRDVKRHTVYLIEEYSIEYDELSL